MLCLSQCFFIILVNIATLYQFIRHVLQTAQILKLAFSKLQAIHIIPYLFQN